MEIIQIVYFIKDDKFNVSSSMNEEAVKECVELFLRGEMGRGKDNSTPEVRDKYTIDLHVYLSDDTINVYDDCGNAGLRDGMLMHYLSS